MHHPIDPDALARVVSSSLNVGGGEYRYQENCGSSNTSTFVKLVRNSDVHDTVIVSVATLVTLDKVDEDLLQHAFDQNIAFLQHPIAVELTLCPTVLASGKPNAEFGFSWVAYKHLDGWSLSSNWHQLQPEIREAVVRNLATFATELAAVQPTFHEDAVPSADYVGSVIQPRVLHSHPLAKEPEYRVTDHDFSVNNTHSRLLKQLTMMHCFKLQRATASPGSKLLAIDQVRAISSVAQMVLDQPYSTVLTHLNLDPQNIWIDPFTGKLTAVLGWELAHFAPTWMAATPPPWLLNEKVDLMLQCEKRSDPWKIWRPHFHHPSKNIGKEMKTLRQIWDTSLRSSDAFKDTWAGDGVARKATRVCFVEEDKLVESLHWAEQVISPTSSPLLRIGFLRLSLILVLLVPSEVVIYAALGGALSLAKMVVGVLTTATLVCLLLMANSYFFTARGGRINVDPKMAAKYLLAIESILFKSRFPWMFGYTPDEVTKKKGLEAIPCSPATSVVPSGIYVPNLMSRAPTVAGSQ